MEATDEIKSILARGQVKSGVNPLAVLDGALSGNAADAVVGGFGYSGTTAAYAKMGKLRKKTRKVPLHCPYREAVHQVQKAAKRLSRKLVDLREDPTKRPYIAYFSKGMFANPTVVIVEIVPDGAEAQAVFTAFTTKVGFVQGHSCNAAIDKLAKLL